VAAASAVLNFPLGHAIGSQLFAHHVEKKPRFLSDREVTNRFIAVSVLYLNHVTTIKSFHVLTFPGLCLGRFFVVKGGEF